MTAAVPVTEAESQATIIEAARTLGYLCHHTRPAVNRSGKWSTPIQGDPGFPDLVIAGHGQIWLVELKRKGGRLTDSQKRWHFELKHVAMFDGVGRRVRCGVLVVPDEQEAFIALLAKHSGRESDMTDTAIPLTAAAEVDAQPAPDDERLWSVTTILKAFGDSDGLIYWSANETAKAAVASLPTLQAMAADGKDADAVEWLRGARFRTAGRSATKLGTDVHAACEQMVVTGKRPAPGDPFAERRNG